jgi:fructokinase
MTHEPARSATLKALQAAKGFNKIISFDPNYRPLLWKDEASAIRAMEEGLSHADMAKLSLEEAQMITGERKPEDCLKSILSYGPSLVVVTMGPEGCVYATSRYQGAFPEYPAHTIDTTGAGDTFWGTVIYELLSRWNGDEAALAEMPGEELSKIMLTANIAAAMSTEKKGAIPSIPDYNRVYEALKRSLPKYS